MHKSCNNLKARLNIQGYRVSSLLRRLWSSFKMRLWNERDFCTMHFCANPPIAKQLLSKQYIGIQRWFIFSNFSFIAIRWQYTNTILINKYYQFQTIRLSLKLGILIGFIVVYGKCKVRIIIDYIFHLNSKNSHFVGKILVNSFV